MSQLDKQMSLIDETAEVVKFLELAGKNAMITDNAMHCRLSACNNVFSVLREGETTIDYILNNLPLVVGRLRKKNENVSPATLKVYKSRVKSSLEDYLAWSRDPIEWEKSVLNKVEASSKKERSDAKARSNGKRSKKRRDEINQEPKASTSTRVNRRMSFPIRPDFDVEIVIPSDGLSAKELLLLQLFLYPFCKEGGQKDDEGSESWPSLPTTKH